jgi:hypothetical protein
MDSSDSSANSPDRSPQKLAEFVGTAIALITLTLPLFTIARYSSNGIEGLPQVTYPLEQARE